MKRWVCLCRCGRVLTYYATQFCDPSWLGMCRHCSKAKRQLPRGRMEHVEAGTLDPEQSMMEREAHEFMSRSLESLVAKRPRYAQVVERMYGLEDGEERTLQVVGDEWSLTRERIRQMEERALALLKKGMVIQGWNRGEETL